MRDYQMEASILEARLREVELQNILRNEAHMESGHIVVRLSVDSMKHQIVTALSARETDLQVSVDRAISNFNFDQEIQRQIERELPGLLKSAITNALSKAIWDSEFRSEIDSRVARMLQRALDSKEPA